MEGLRFVRRQHTLLGLITLDLFAVLFGGATALLPIFASDVLRIGPVGLGLLRSAPGVGAALAASLLALRPIERHAGAWMFAGVGLFGSARWYLRYPAASRGRSRRCFCAAAATC